jgi:hypothetical protein
VGGGTVDLITFSIVDLEPNLCLKEAPGDGALCGSTFLNRRSEEFLNQLLSSISGWGHDTLEEALYRFETVIKRTINDYVNQDSMFPVPEIIDDSAIGICVTPFPERLKFFLPSMVGLQLLGVH